MASEAEVEAAARAIWNTREGTFPTYVRMTWDAGTAIARETNLMLARAALEAA
jgi:hypothetical protein